MTQQKGFNFVKLRNIMLLVTVFALWFSVFSNEQVEGIIAFVFIFTFGILHGSNDILLIQIAGKGKAGKGKAGKYYKAKIFILYILTVLLILLLFSFLPALALLFFILISGFHFGEQHWRKNLIKQSVWDNLFFTLYGLFILLMIFYVKHEHASPIINDISGFSAEKGIYLIVLGIVGVLLLLQWVLYFYLGRLKGNILEELFFLVVFFIIFNTLLYSGDLVFTLLYGIVYLL